jgi:dUTP pyrophosphatase
MLIVSIKRLTPTAGFPVKGSQGAACFDLHVNSVKGEQEGWAVHTGLAIALPPGYGMFIFPRSGLGTKLGLTLRNGTGVIDSDYRGEIIIRLTMGHDAHWQEINEALKPGSRIAQATILQIPEIVFQEVSNLPETTRGTGGFGSTGT